MASIKNFVAAALVAFNITGAAAQVSVDEILNNRISDNNIAQSDSYSRGVVVDTIYYKASDRAQTGFFVELRAGGKLTTGVLSPVGVALLGYRFSWGSVAGYGGGSRMERNGADVSAGEEYFSLHIGAELAILLLQDHSGKFLGDWRTSLVGRVGGQTFKHDEATDEFTLHDGTNYQYIFGETGMSLSGALGIRHEIRLSKANALFLTIQGMVEYTNDPKINSQVRDRIGGELTLGLEWVIGKTHYTPYGKALKDAGLLSSIDNTSINNMRK